MKTLRILAALVLGALVSGPALAAGFYWRAEGTTLSATDDNSADTSATATGGISISATAMKLGTNGLLTTNNADYYAFTVTSKDICDEREGELAGWFQAKGASFPASGANVILECRDGGTSRAAISIGSSEEARLTLTSAGGTTLLLATTGCNMVINTWYYIVAKWHIANDDRSIACYTDGGNGTLVDGQATNPTVDLSTDIATAAPGAFTELRVGNPGNYAEATWVDGLKIAVTYGKNLENYAFTTSYKPAFSAGPTAGDHSDVTEVFSYTPSHPGTEYSAACTNGQTVTTFANLKTGTCSGGAAVGTGTDSATTAVGQSVTITGLTQGTTYDTYHGFESGLGGQSDLSSLADQATDTTVAESDVFAFPNEDRLPDTGQTIIGIGSVSATGLCDLDTYFDPDCAVGDVFEYDSVAIEDTACAISVGADGDVELIPDVNTECVGKRSFGISYQDVSDATTGLFDAPAGVGDFTNDDIVYNDNTPPTCSGDDVAVVLTEDVAITDIDLLLLGGCSDDDGDILDAVVNTGTLPSGITLAEEPQTDPDSSDDTGVWLLSGTPSTEDEDGEIVEFSITDPATDEALFQRTFYVINTWTMTNVVGMTESEALDAILVDAPWRSLQPDFTISGSVCSESTPGTIVSQDPAASAEIGASDALTAIIAVDCGEPATEKKIVYVLASLAGLTRWTDYIPVSEVLGCAAGRYDENGCWAVQALSSTVGKTAWVDYIPVGVVTPVEGSQWRYENDGWIPVDNLTP